MNVSVFDKIVITIKESKAYENIDNWISRGLNPSDNDTIALLRDCTNKFLDKLQYIEHSNPSSETKSILVNNLVDDLPWDDFDTEEKEFLADTLAPAINAMGLDAWSIF